MADAAKAFKTLGIEDDLKSFGFNDKEIAMLAKSDKARLGNDLAQAYKVGKAEKKYKAVMKGLEKSGLI